MKCTISKDVLQEASSALTKLAHNPGKIYLIVDEVSLSIVANTITYLKFTIPAEDCTPGMVSIKGELFNGFLNLRGASITLEKVNNTLKVTGGSTLDLYCSEMFKEEIKIPEINVNDIIKLPSKSMAIFKTLVKQLIFNPTEKVPGGTPVNIINNETSFTIGLADTVHCAFYSCNPIINKNFEIVTELQTLKDVFTFLSDRAQLSVSSDTILIKSSNLITTIPTLQNGNSSIVSAKEFLDDEKYLEGELIINYDSLSSILKSISGIAAGSDILNFSIGSKKISVKLKTVYGRSLDYCQFISNSLENVELNLPLLMFENVLYSCSLGEELRFKLSENLNFYRMTTSDKDIKIECIGPISNSK